VHYVVHYKIRIVRMVTRCFCVHIILFVVIVAVTSFIISRSILFKMLVLGINEKVFAILLKCSFDHSPYITDLHLYWENDKLSLSL
jgi:hypothetical protein